MPMQSQRGSPDGAFIAPRGHDRTDRSPIRRLSPDIVAALAGGLRAVYEEAPASDIPDAFADLLGRIEAAERAPS